MAEVAVAVPRVRLQADAAAGRQGLYLLPGQREHDLHLVVACHRTRNPTVSPCTFV